MNELLWLENRPLQGNATGIPTSQNLDILEGLESSLCVRNHRIPVELPHMTELELEKLRRTRTDSGKAFALKLLWGPLTSWEVLWPLEPRLSLYYTKNELGSTIGS
jgi:hypothetical protein